MEGNELQAEERGLVSDESAGAVVVPRALTILMGGTGGLRKRPVLQARP